MADAPEVTVTVPAGNYVITGPTARLTVNAVVIDSAFEFQTDNNAFYAADQFSASVVLTQAQNTAWWGNAANSTASVMVDYMDDASGAWVNAFQGRVEKVDPISWGEQTVSVSGRDNTALLIDARTMEAFTNKTSSEIATILAGRVGLTADVQATTRLAGKLYDADHQIITLGNFNHAQSYWKLITTLAEAEGFSAWVDGTTLHFKPVSSTPTSENTYLIKACPVTYSNNIAYFKPTTDAHNVVELHMSQNMAAKDVQVTVTSWNADNFASYTASYPAKAKGSDADTPYHKVIPGLTQQQCTDRAKQIYEQIIHHMHKIDFTKPGDSNLNARFIVVLSGTDSDFDTNYYITNIKRRMSFEEGFTMEVTAKSVLPASEGGSTDA